MLFDEGNFARFAMKLDEMTDAGKMYIDGGEVGSSLGLDPHESMMLAKYLEDEGWAEIVQKSSSQFAIRLKLQGRRAIAEMCKPKWQRWITKHHPTINTMLAAAAITISVGSLLARWLFGW